MNVSATDEGRSRGGPCRTHCRAGVTTGTAVGHPSGGMVDGGMVIEVFTMAIKAAAAAIGRRTAGVGHGDYLSATHLSQGL